MSRVHYTIQVQQQLPADLDWLTPAEKTRFEGFRFAKRRGDWLLGRWAAKVALLGDAGLPQRDIDRFEITTAADGAPLPRFDGEPYAVALSLSHSHDRALAAVLQNATALGCDIELVEPRSAGFVDTYFTAGEAEAVKQAEPALRDQLITLIWSAKESTLKALRTGLRADTRSVQVVLADLATASGWRAGRTVTRDDGEFACRWRRDGHFIATLVTRDPVPESRLLEI